jgi:LuxR family maltose regulon positive regulatory protein
MGERQAKPRRGLATRRRIIERPRLTRLLDQTQARIIVLVAPAGYGKTTLAREWLASRRSAWYQSNAASTDVAAFAAGLANAAAPLLPRPTNRVSEWVERCPDPTARAESLAELVARELSALASDTWLVIDDFHLTMDSEAAALFFERFEAAAPIRILLTSRRRPSWVSARRLLYGEVYELGQAALAMTEDEADQILGQSRGRSAGGLVALAEGWPAVIGLAALADGPIPSEGSVPGALYDYFAEELYQKTNRQIQSHLSVLALTPSLAREVIVDLFGETDSDIVLSEACRLGFVAPRQGGVLEMHPLLRTFLLSKFNEETRDFRDSAVRRIFAGCLDRGAWDDAYSVAVATEAAVLVPKLVNSALADVLDAGRITTLQTWVEFARERGVRSPILTLADAEIAFRHGWHQKAEAIARQAATEINSAEPMHARAHLRAGQAAYFNDRHTAALRSFDAAWSRSSEDEIRREAIWASFLTSIDLEDPSAAKYLERYERLLSGGPDDAVRLATGRLSLAYRQGYISEGLDAARSASYVVDEASDPMVRSSFWNAYAWALTFNSRYEEALEAAERELNEARDHDLDFIVPHATLVSAQAHLGLHQVLEASRLLDEVDQVAQERADDFLAVNVRTLRARMYVATNRIYEALAALAEVETAPQSRATRGERIAVKALALLLDGRISDASLSAGEAHEGNSSQATRSLADLVSAIIESETESSTSRLATAISSLWTNGQLDALVLAYRARPTLLLDLATTVNERDFIDLVTRTRDRTLAREMGLFLDGDDAEPPDPLSPREREVSALLAQGQTNAEIAKALYISEVTVKVHVRHILQKLGVRNRAQAAVLVATRRPTAEVP